nr:hypothetical protein [Tanacetum cinerariifolium]
AIVNTARPKAVLNAVKGNKVYAVKASAYWIWKPKTKWTCLRHHLQSPTLLSTPILNQEGADEELSDGGSLRVIVYKYDGLPIMPVAPPSPDYVPGPEERQTPPAPQDEDEHKLRFIQPHDPDFVPEPIYPDDSEVSGDGGGVGMARSLSTSASGGRDIEVYGRIVILAPVVAMSVEGGGMMGYVPSGEEASSSIGITTVKSAGAKCSSSSSFSSSSSSSSTSYPDVLPSSSSPSSPPSIG